MNKRLSGFYLTIAIIGIITAVPVLGNMLDVFKILTFILLGFSIYVLIKQPKRIKKTAAVLMIISCALSLIGGLIVLGALGSISTTDTMSSYEAGEALGTMVGGSILGMIFTLPAWVLKILAIIFSFQASSKLKSLD
ncbi:hypothetical protein ACODH8_14330 [Vagococcus fluvialis]|uniref:hypothetical protein n=1 Tax=Vagococcus fluvialis TaxID=2738 RepID=UPI003B5AE372